MPGASPDEFHGGTGFAAWRWLGAHPRHQDGLDGYAFAVWAPHAEGVAVCGDWNDWRGEPLARDARGVWRGFCAGAEPGQFYKLRVVDVHGLAGERSDPFGFAHDLRPGTASRLCPDDTFAWRDARWLKRRAEVQRADRPLSIYEVHLGSWQRWGDAAPGYRELAPLLADHVARLGFTHVEFLPPMEHPYDPSWGYQVTGHFAPTARHGGPDDFRFLVDTLHRRGIGVLVDWVPAHFPRDPHALAFFDGTPLYEHPDPQRGMHPDWGTNIFDYGRPEVVSFLLASAHFWIASMHVDGLRVDAVASMLYRDYSRGPGQWTPNVMGGTWNLEAIAFLRALNRMVHAEFPGVLCIAEESTVFPQVSGEIEAGGLGFDYKWNMGWMHDTLAYFGLDPLWRCHHHDKLTFPFTYAHVERFLLPLSHDEVVHGKGALVRKMTGLWHHGLDQLRLLFGGQWLHPGKKLLFMGQEFGQDREWNQDVGLDWHLCADEARQGLLRWVAALNRLYRDRAALHAGDCDPRGFAWVEGANRDESILVFSRHGGGDELVAVIHHTPVDRPLHLVPVPALGSWRTVLSSALRSYGGDRAGLPPPVEAVVVGGRPMAPLDVAPFAVLVIERVAT